MRLDLQTLWCLTIGTLLLSAALMFWERQSHPERARVLSIWAWSLLVFVIGCVVAMNRQQLPGASGAALSNILMVSGYLLVLHGAARLDGPGHLKKSATAIGALAVLWAIMGVHFPAAFWSHVSAAPIALICGLTAWTLLRSPVVRGLRSRPIAVAVSACHSLFYLGRAVVMPVLVEVYGDSLLLPVAKATMFEAVLYSVGMPMAFLMLIREEAQAKLLAAAQSDPLTGLANRRGFLDEGGRVWAAHPADEPIALLAFDLDRFKTINDRHGHAVGDEVLKLFATVARDVVGRDAILVRLGGEEFAAILPSEDAQRARRIGERIARRFSDEAARLDGLAVEATVSMGLATPGPDRGDLSELLASADRALYQAKTLGRNRLEIATATVRTLAA
jgi:diguanylate cyclase (GGDEF)-like protein